jgi:muramidase (phage lysozyme)
MPELNPYLKGIDTPASSSQANIDNYLEFLSKAEGADYDTIVGGGKFKDFSKHPGVVGTTTREGPSTAAGKFQITKTTYDDIAPKIGVTDFSPESQKKIALKLIEDKGALEDVQKGDYEAANAKLGKVWASLPSSPYKQPKRSQEWVEETLKATMQNAADKADTAQPLQVLDRPDSSDNPYLKGITSKTKTMDVQPGSETENPFRKGIAVDNPYLKGVKPKEEISPLKSFGKSFAGSASKAIAASPAMAIGAELGVEAGLLTGPYAPIAAPVLGLVGGVGGYLAGEKAVSAAYDKFVPENIKEAIGYGKATREAEMAANPESSYAGELTGNLALFRPGSLANITLPGGKVITPLAQRATLGGVSGGIEAGSEALSGGELNPQRIAEATAFGAIAAKPTAITRHADKLASNLISRVPGSAAYETRLAQGLEADRAINRTQERTTEGTTQERAAPEQRDLFQQELTQAEQIQNRGQVFEPGATRTTPTDAVIRSEQEIDLAKMEAKQTRSRLEEDIPDVRNREQITMSIEGQKRQDRLLSDREKAEELRVLQLSILKKQNLANAMEREPLNIVLQNTKNKDAYNNLKNKEGFPKEGTQTEQLAFLRKDIDNTIYGHNTLRDRPSDQPSFGVRDYVVNEFRRLGERARSEGLFPQLRRDYVTHALDFTDSVINKEQQKALSDYLYSNTNQSRFVRDFTQARQFRYIRDLENALRQAGDELGINTRGIKVQRDIAKIMEIYKNAMGRAIVEKRLVNYLLKTKMDGSPVIELGYGSPIAGQVKELPILTDNIEQGFKNNYVKFTGQGSDVLQDVMVHPDFKDVLGYVFKQDDPTAMLEAFKSVSMLSKFLNTAGSLFHATSLAVAQATAAPKLFLKEMMTGGSGIRAALKDLEHKGVGPQGELLIKNGLKVATEDVQRTIIGDAAGTADKLIGDYLAGGKNVKVLRQMSDPLENHFLNHMNRFTWDYMHAGGKLNLAQHFFTQIKSKHPEIPDDQIAAEVASFVNNTLGGLNWLQVANQVENKFLKGFALKAMKLQNRDWAQIVLFAPDWTVSTLRSFTKALPKELMKPQNWELRAGVKGLIDPTNNSDLARRYVLTTGLLWLTILNGFNMAFTGRPIWTNKDPTRVDLGDGTAMQMAKHSMEAAHWLLDPEKTLGNKLGFIPKGVITMTTGKAYPSPKAPMVKDNTTLGRLVHSAKAALPFQISAAAAAPPGEGGKRALASFLGVPIYGQTDKANSTAEVLAERRALRKESRIKNRLDKLEQQYEESKWQTD